MTYFCLMLSLEEQYMYRCLDLALKGIGWVAPNPMVGAVLVHDNRIIGEGWHEYYGGPHAEVNCIKDAIQRGNEYLFTRSTLYVSLEPCAHQGKTPPCDQLIIQYKIPKVVIGCRDPFYQVNGKGIEHLREHGIEVRLGVLQKEAENINKRFFCQHTQHRPYIILKWAQTADGYIGTGTSERLRISSEMTNKLVHRWRSEESAILVGSRTVMLDNPYLNNRSGMGAQPVRIVLDRQLSLKKDFYLFDGTVKTIILNEIKNEEGILTYSTLDKGRNLPEAVCKALLKNNIQSVLIEGGAQILSFFLQAGCWDEARVITNSKMKVERGICAPVLLNATLHEEDRFEDDIISYFYNHNNKFN
jgi:diaminohydroxyphosphoribosylaminopyrimidine deaminase/5-amino-6-(5-phosphoribosylamino)uracil reductase